MVKLSRSQIDKHLLQKSKFRSYPKLPKYVIENNTTVVDDPRYEEGRLRAIEGLEADGNNALMINSFLHRVDNWDKYHKPAELEKLARRREKYEKYYANESSNTSSI